MSKTRRRLTYIDRKQKLKILSHCEGRMSSADKGENVLVLQDISSQETQEDNLRKDKDNACQLCGKAFNQWNNVKRHMEKVHHVLTEEDSMLPMKEKENKPNKQISKNVTVPKPKIPLKVTAKRNSKGLKLSRLKEKKLKKKSAKKVKDKDSVDELEITAHCSLCRKGFKGRCGQSNMERHRRNVHGLQANQVMELQTEELSSWI